MTLEIEIHFKSMYKTTVNDFLFDINRAILIEASTC